MKRITVAAIVVLLAVLASPAFAGASRQDACQRKEEAIARQLEIARQYNNHGKIRGLERALLNLRTWCSDDGLLHKAESKIKDKRDEVREREEELAEARAEGKKPDTIAKRERKLADAKTELREALGERDALLESINNAGE